MIKNTDRSLLFINYILDCQLLFLSYLVFNDF